MYNRLHTHPGMEGRCNVPHGHVIVDAEDRNLVLSELEEMQALLYDIMENGYSARELLIKSNNSMVSNFLTKQGKLYATR